MPALRKSWKNSTDLQDYLLLADELEYSLDFERSAAVRYLILRIETAEAHLQGLQPPKRAISDRVALQTVVDNKPINAECWAKLLELSSNWKDIISLSEGADGPRASVTDRGISYLQTLIARGTE